MAGNLKKLKLNISGLRDLRCSPEVAAYCETLMRSRMVAAGADDGYEVIVTNGMAGRKGAVRAHVICRAATPQARRSNMKHNTLAKVVG